MYFKQKDIFKDMNKSFLKKIMNVSAQSNRIPPLKCVGRVVQCSLPRQGKEVKLNGTDYEPPR